MPRSAGAAIAANGEPGVAARCTTHRAALAAAEAAQGCQPTSLTVHLGTGDDAGVVLATGDVDALTSSLAPHADIALHRTATRRLLRHRRTWAAGEPTPGVTQLYLTRRRPGLATADYHRYWELEHGPRALRHHLGMWDYAQVSVTGTHRGEPVDGIAVTQWPTAADLEQRFTDGAVGDAVIRHDAGRFTNLGALARHRLDERVVVEAPWPTTGAVAIADFRSISFERPAGHVWRVLGRFGALLDWWPGGFTSCAAPSDDGPGATRTLARQDGSLVVERLVEHRPDERMLQLAIDEGLPPAVASYTCRYEVRAEGDHRCRLDWYPRAVVRAQAVAVFGAIVDRGWPMVAEGLTAAVSDSW